MNYKNCEIIVFFSGGINSYYQINQWEKPFEKLNKKHKILYVITDYEVYLKFIKEQDLEAIYMYEFTNIIEFYQENEFAITLYINNSLRNFQALRYSRGYHVHLNHGESEKESMRSNQSQAYDYVFTVGKRATKRYKEYLLNFNPNKFIEVGRPQLDFISPMKIDKKPNQKVLLYAPTWEATHSSMNYTSVSIFGVELVKQILNNENFILIYKPHDALGTRDENVELAHQSIMHMISESKNGYYMADEDINNVFTLVDFTFFDNTSVMIDYLHTNKPAAYIEIIEDQSINELSKAFVTLNHTNFKDFLQIIHKEMKHDPNCKKRKIVKEYYLGNYKLNQSSKKFINAISKIIKKRNRKISNILK